jgi:hypothetical protein
MAIKYKYVYYPQNFDLDNFCKDNKLPAHKVAGILHLFIFKPKGNEDSRDISLSSTILKKNFKDIYKNILECLIVNGVIENTTEYSKGKARKFQLTDKYQFSKGTKKISRETKQLNDVLKKDNELIAKQKYEEQLKLPKLKRTSRLPHSIFSDWYSPLIKWFVDGKLEINEDKALSIMKSQNIHFTEPEKYLEYISMIDVFKDKDYHLKSDKNFRFYSSLTNLPRILRGSLTYDGKKLAGADVSNTQPLLMGTLCDIDFLKRLKREKHIEVDDILFNEFLAHLESSPMDLIAYKELVQKGRLYESFSDISPEFTRETVKYYLIRVINDKGIDKKRQKVAIRKAIKERFPTIWMLLELLKSKNHKYVSSTLMSIEAQNFVINFPQEFYYQEEHQNIPLFMVHDCFFTTEENIDYMERYIKNYYAKFLSIELPLKRETLK